MSHYISPAPFDPYSVEVMTPAQERFYRASQWQLMWWRFRRHRVAVVSGALLLAFYAIILFCEFLAPYGLDSRHTDFIYAPPQRIRIFDHGVAPPESLAGAVCLHTAPGVRKVGDHYEPVSIGTTTSTRQLRSSFGRRSSAMTGRSLLTALSPR